MSMPETFTTFFSTPSDEMKDFTRAGGFKGKSVSPYYLVKRLTERFGLCGKGWKVKHYETREVHAPNGIILVYVLLSLLYKEKGDTEWNEVGPHYGGDVAISFKKAEKQTKNADGTFNMLEGDDEACKKAYTDAFSKCCSWLGLAGDIHDGFADGDKYQATKPWDVDPRESKKSAIQPPPPARDEWDEEALGVFADLLDTQLYQIFQKGGQPQLFADESEKWKERKKADAPSKVLPNLKARVAALETAMNEALAKTKGNPSQPEATPEPVKEGPQPGTPEYAAHAKKVLAEACARFQRQYATAGEADPKKAALAMRDKLASTLILKGGESLEERKVLLAEAMQKKADELKIPE